MVSEALMHRAASPLFVGIQLNPSLDQIVDRRSDGFESIYLDQTVEIYF